MRLGLGPMTSPFGMSSLTTRPNPLDVTINVIVIIIITIIIMFVIIVIINLCMNTTKRLNLAK